MVFIFFNFQFLMNQKCWFWLNNPSGNISLEFDDDNIPEGCTKEEQINLMKTQLKSLINKIISKTTLEEMPRSLRSMAYIVHKHASKYSPENKHILVGGFIFLRFFFYLKSDTFFNPKTKKKKKIFLSCFSFTQIFWYHFFWSRITTTQESHLDHQNSSIHFK